MLYAIRYRIARGFIRLASWIIPTSRPVGMVLYKKSCEILRNY